MSSEVIDLNTEMTETDVDDNKDNIVDINWEDFIDERDEIEWVDVFKVDAFGDKHQLKSQNVHRWLGADWSLLIQLNGKQNYGMFVGYDNSDHFPQYWCANVLIEFILIKDDSSENSIFFDTYYFEKKDDDRIDRGSSDCLDKELINSDEITIKVKLREFSTKLNMPLMQRKIYNSKKATDMVGLINNGATCYLNSLLQMLFNINKFRHSVYQLPHEDEVISESTTLALQSVFKNLQNSNYEVSTSELTTAFGWSNQDADIQQDVQEMMRVLLDKLEEKMKGTVVEGAIKSLFAGKFCSYIKCVNVDYGSQREEDFYDIQLEVKNCNNIYDSFKKYTEVETLDGENQYDAGDFGKQDARKGVCFTSFPPVLTIHLKRFDFDFNTMNFIKIHDNYEFPAHLSLDEYLSPDAPHESKNNKYLLHSVLVHAGDVGGGHYYAYIRPSKGYDYSTAEASMKQAKEALEKLQFQPSSMTVEEAKLKLSGDGAGGKWFKFNDEIVTTAQSKEAIKFCYGSSVQNRKIVGGNSGSAYMLVYIKESMAADLMNERQCEIPSSLLERLEKERLLRDLEKKKRERLKMFQVFKFTTENGLNTFDPLEFTENIMRGSYHLYALMKISKTLRVHPLKIKLWSVEYLTVQGNWNERELNLVTDYKGYFNEFYYVQIENDVSSDSMDTLNNLISEEVKLIENFKKELESLGLEEKEIKDYLDGCGIGGSPKALNIVPDEAVRTLLMEQLSELTEKTLEVFSRVFSTDPDNSKCSVFFLKLYDPQDILPKLIRQPLSSSFKRNLEITDISMEETLKYLGSVVVPYEMLNTSVDIIIDDILRYYRLMIKNKILPCLAPNSDTDDILTILWDFVLLYSFGFRSYPAPLYDFTDSKILFRQNDYLRSGAEFVIELNLYEKFNLNKNIQRFLPNDSYYFKGFVHAISCKRIFSVYPFDQRDKDIVNRLCKGIANAQPLKKLKLASGEDADQEKDQEEIFEKDASTFILDIPYYLSWKKVFDLISERLKISPKQLILQLTNDREIGLRENFITLTYDFLEDTETIKTVAEKLRIPKTASRFYYMVSPFEISDPDIDGLFKFCMNLTDENSRMHREKFLNSNPDEKIYPEFIDEKSVYLEISWDRDAKLHECIADIKTAIGIPSSLTNTEEIEIADYSESKYERFLSERLIRDPESHTLKFPKYPVLTYVVDPLHDAAIITHSMEIKDYFGFSLGGLPKKRKNLCFQHVSRENLDLMAGLNDSDNFKSVPVIVCNFTLNGKAAESIENFGMPFNSFIKTDDDFESLASRLVSLTGDTEILKLRLAYVHDKIPHFFQRSATSSETQNTSIWNFISSIRHASPCRGPIWIGIQRSASSIVSTRKVIGSITIK